MADTPEVPDLKKAQENKPAGFAWTPGGTVAKAAASAAAASGRAQAPTMLERLRAQGPGKIALFAVLLLTGGLVFTFAAFRFAGTADGGGGGGALGGVASTMKIRFARQNDPTGFVVREKAAAGEKMRFDLIKGAADKAPGDVTTGGTGVPGGDGGGAPMNYDDGATSRAGTSGGAGGAGAPGPGKDGGQGGAGGFAGGGGAKLNSSYGSIKFQGMRRVSGTAGFRSIQGGRGNPNKTIQTRGSSANPYGAGAGTNAASGGAAAPGGRGSSAGGIRSNQTADNAGGGAGAGAGGGSGSPGGGGGVGDTSTIDDVESTPATIANLLAEAQSENEKAEDEKKKAIALKAAGQDPQAAYHYDRYRKAKKSADEKAAEADRLTAGMAGAVDGVTVTPNPAPANPVRQDSRDP